MERTWNNFGRFERPGSTWCWEICFRNGAVRKGYTKPAGQAEPFPHDKTKLLVNRLNCLLKKGGYLQKIQWMAVHRCFSDSDADNVAIFTLYPERYVLSPRVAAMPPEETRWLREFLDGLFSRPEERYGTELFPKSEPKQLPTVAVPHVAVPLDKMLDVKRKRFRSVEELLAYVDSELQPLVKRGILAQGRLLHFYQQYVERHLE